jgi:hypothetical protein
MTDGLASPESDAPTRTLPGACPSARFDVITITTTVPIRLALKGFDWTTRTGLRRPGPEPAGAGSDAHQISPRFMSDGSKLGLRQSIVNSVGLSGINGIEFCRNRIGPLRPEVCCKRFRVKATASHLALSGKQLGSLEYRIGNGNSHFHQAMVSPGYDQDK